MDTKIQEMEEEVMEGKCIKCEAITTILAKGLCRPCYESARRERAREQKAEGIAPSKRAYKRKAVPVKKRETKAGYFETFGARVDELVRGIETKEHEIATLRKKQGEMRLQLLKSRHEILQEIDKKAVEKALKIAENMSDDGKEKKEKADA